MINKKRSEIFICKHCKSYGLFILLFLSFTTYGKDILVRSPGENNDIQPAIQNAVDKASDGDRVILPEGLFVINSSVRITKFISFIGKGLKKTILYRAEAIPDSVLSSNSWQSIFDFNIKSDHPSNILVSSICFKGKKPAVKFGDGGSRASTIGIRMEECVDFIIEKCRFEYFGYAAIWVRHKDTLARGVIKNNEFYYNARFGLGYGILVIGIGKEWVPDPKFGSANFIFIEDNIFDYHRHSIASSLCGLFVFRYNTVLNNIAASGGHAVDMHEARAGNGDKFGTRAIEAYNNVLINTTYTDSTLIVGGAEKSASGASLENAGIAIRNGDALVYNNKVHGYRYAVSLSNWYLGGKQQEYPVLYGPGYLSGKVFGPDHTGIYPPQSDGDAFCWNNSNDPYNNGKQDIKSVFKNSEPAWWNEGRDYHMIFKPGYKAYVYPYQK